MKKLTFSLLAAALATGLASAQTAYTTPVGYETINLPAGVEYNVMGLRLQKPTVSAGLSTAVSGTVFSHSNVDFEALLTSGTTYILEITSGSASGLIQEVATWGTSSGNTANDVVAGFDLTVLGVVAGDSYVLRAAPTLEEIFNTTNLTPSFVASSADLVWVPNGAGGFDQYFISSLVGNPWKNAATNVNSPNVPVVYQDGLLVQKRAASPTTAVTVSGEVKLTSTISPLLAGTAGAPSYNTLGTVYPAGLTLQNSGIAANLQTGFIASAADIVAVPDGAGGFNEYYVSALAGNPWKDASTNANVLVDVPLTSGILITRKGPAVNLTFTPPPSYSNL